MVKGRSALVITLVAVFIAGFLLSFQVTLRLLGAPQADIIPLNSGILPLLGFITGAFGIDLHSRHMVALDDHD